MIMEVSEIKQFYKSMNVFVTGATGFMGKILIEKLLRSTDVDTVYILVREKHGQNMHSRIDELFDNMVFDRLKNECPKFKHRVQPLNGDCAISGLGLSIIDRQTLISNVNIIFHVAATTKFDQNLKEAYAINVHGTKEIINLAKLMKHLKAMIHVSTAYSNCNRESIDENFYDCPYTYRDIRDVLEKISKHEADIITPKILGDFPNTYVFTKHLTESMIKEIGHGIPLGIFRPAIVISTYKEPIEGWADNMYGATGITVGVISGIIRISACDEDCIADIVPVDTCIAGLIASAWEVGNRDCQRTSEDITIYNYVSSPENSLTWREFLMIGLTQVSLCPPHNIIFPIFMVLVSYRQYTFLRIFLHTLPAVIMDFLLVLIGKKTRMLKIYGKIHRQLHIMSYFTLRSWKFRNNNLIKLWNKLNCTDKELFPLSMTTVHWTIYFRKYILGIRIYVLKDPLSTLDYAVKRIKRVNIIYGIIKYALLIGLSHLVLYVTINIVK